MMKTHVIYIAIILLLLMWRDARSPPEVRAAWMRDTVRETVFVPRRTEVVRVDTIWVHDTIRVPLPIERKVYVGAEYRAVVEGFRPELAAMEIYRKTPRPKHWGIGIQAGYGVGEGGLTPYIGVGVSYNILSF